MLVVSRERERERERESIAIFRERERGGETRKIARRETTLIKRISVKETRERERQREREKREETHRTGKVNSLDIIN